MRRKLGRLGFCWIKSDGVTEDHFAKSSARASLKVGQLDEIAHQTAIESHHVFSTFQAADRDRGTPRGAAPATPPGIRVTYHGGSTGLSFCGDINSGQAEFMEDMVAQDLLD